MYSCNFDEVSVQMQDYLNVKFKETGHSNMYFPQVFFSTSLLWKLAVVLDYY